MPQTILMIEDEAPVRTFLRAALADAKLHVIEAATALDGLRMVAEQSPALVLLDLGLPDLDGVEVIKRIRASSHLPIIVLSARGQERDKVAAFELGADDYVAKPVGAGELVARIEVALRHAEQAGTPTSPGSLHIRAGRIEVDLSNRQVRVAGQPVSLNMREYDLLALLAHNYDRLLTDRFLAQEVWGARGANEVRQMRLAIAALRHKLEENPTVPRHILTEQGIGYRFSTQ
jgi:two-component system KDP operon response regulator KdpE